MNGLFEIIDNYYTVFASVLVALFTIVDPFAAVPVFLAMTPNDTPGKRTLIARNTSLYFTAILLVFFLLGSQLLALLGISLNAIRVAGGLIILNSGFALLNNKFAENRTIDEAVEEEALHKPDISFSPMAMPLLAGPGSISLLIALYGQYQSWDYRILICFVIIILGLLTYWTLRVAPWLSKLLGVAGMNALARIMGFLTMALGVQMMILGVVTLAKMYIKQKGG